MRKARVDRLKFYPWTFRDEKTVLYNKEQEIKEIGLLFDA